MSARMIADDDARSRPATRGSYASGLAFGTASFGLVAIVGIVSSVVTARIFGVEIIGEFALAYAPTGAVWFLSSVREQAALVRELTMLEPRAPRVTGLFTAVLVFSATLTAVVSAIAVAASWFVFRGPLGHPELFLPACANLATYTVLTNVGWNVDAIFTSFLSGHKLLWIRLHQAVANLVIAVPLGLVWPSVWSLVIAMAGASLTSGLHRIWAVRPLMRMHVPRAVVNEGFKTLPDLLRFGVRAAPGTVLTGMSTQLATWALGVTATPAVVGAYNRAWMVGSKFLELNFRITEMLLPTLAKRRGDGDVAGFDRALVDTMRYAAIGMLLIAACLGGAAHDVMRLYGAGFARASDALAVLMLVPALQTLSATQTQAFYAVDRPLSTTVIASVRFLVSLGATIAGIEVLGLTGAALGLVCGQAVDVLVKLYLLRPHLGAPLSRMWTPQQMAALAGAYAIGLWVARRVAEVDGSSIDLVPAMAAGALAFVAVLRLAGGLTQRDMERTRALLSAWRSGPRERSTL